MRSIRPIPKNEQIYNTYGNLPNADLLRRYGYIIPGSRDDLVEISTEIIIEIVSSHNEEEIRRRIDILDEEAIFEEYRLRMHDLILELSRYRFQERYQRKCMFFVWR